MDTELQKLIHAFKRAGNPTGFVKLFTAEELERLEVEIDEQKILLYLEELQQLGVEIIHHSSIRVTNHPRQRLACINDLKPNYEWAEQFTCGNSMWEGIAYELKRLVESVKAPESYLAWRPKEKPTLVLLATTETPNNKYVLFSGYPLTAKEIATKKERAEKAKETAKKRAEKNIQQKLKKLKQDAKKYGLELTET